MKRTCVATSSGSSSFLRNAVRGAGFFGEALRNSCTQQSQAYTSYLLCTGTMAEHCTGYTAGRRSLCRSSLVEAGAEHTKSC